MLEVEMKFPVHDLESLIPRLEQSGASLETVRSEEDHYFNAPDRDFARTDEALRIRRIGERNFVTYKGPKRDLQTKTRTEIETPLAEGDESADQFRQILLCLGYRAVAVVRKKRRIFHWRQDAFEIEVCLDEVEGVGTFVELEIQATEELLESARNLLLRSAEHLGLKESERRSYLEMLLASKTEIVTRNESLGISSSPLPSEAAEKVRDHLECRGNG